MTRNLELSPNRLAKILSAMIATLLIANIAAIYLKLNFGFSYNSFIGVFYFNKEANIPTLYSFLSILLAAFFLWQISNLRSERRQNQHLFWKTLTCIFVFLGIDEFISIHETLTDNTQGVLGDFNADGYLHFAWVVPYTIIFLAAFFLMGRSFLRLPSNTQMMFLLAGSIFVSGAVGMELVGGRYIFIHGEVEREGLTYAMMVTCEELLEMVGVLLFIYTLAKYYLARVENHAIRFHLEMKVATTTAMVATIKASLPRAKRQQVGQPVSYGNKID